MKKVYVTRPIMEAGINLLKEHFEVTVQPEERDLNDEEFLNAIKGYDGVLTMLTNKVDENTFKTASSVKVFANYAVGFNNIDVDMATDYGVAITNTPNALTMATAELAWALLFAASRHVVQSDKLTREGKFTSWDPMGFLGQPVSGKKLGIIGAGRIGMAFARMAKGFNMDIYYNSPHRKRDFEKETGAHYEDLFEMLPKVDYLAIHCPYNLSTHHLIGERELALMKPNAILVNTARGAIIDEKALYEALKHNKIYSAGLDVYENEPQIYPGLTELENVITCSHIGSATYDSREAMSILAAQSIVDILIDNKIPDNCLNKEVF
ncbi:MAG: d-isomer specific 2-hydroxyacid dehydrogenase nad-binding protein [Fusobacteria bacterium]|nr:MAG: d-isomer specific 2-hydroxyacid dehydrogenase nad-binding protein [Fusobacteriota bacterium]KAF0228804.1 MAG: d-isomer specific 2-hydroxyacid dehydrogenase nad-binding [Fusobacteriota bacterium]